MKISLFLTMALAVSAAVNADSNIETLVPKGGFAAPHELSDKYEVQTAVATNISFANDPAGGYRKVLRMELHAAHDKVANGFRTEILPKYEYVLTGTRWYGISFMLPDDWAVSDAPFVMGQIHVAQRDTKLPPAISVLLRKHQLYFALQRTNFDVYSPERQMTVDDLTTIRVPIGDIRRNKWECFVVRADWSSVKGRGSLDIWSNGVKIYSEVDAHNTYASHLGQYPKIGLYAPWKLDASMRYIYTDFIWVGNETASHDDIYSRTPCGLHLLSAPMPPRVMD